MTDTQPTPRRKRSARFIEIAAAAGVSVATVNRVLNERDSVAPATREKVVAAAKRLAVPRLLPDLRRGITRFDVVMARSPTPYFRRLDQALQRAMQMLDRRIAVHRQVLDEDDDARIADAILHPPQRRHGLIVAIHDSPAVRAALRTVIAQGVPVVTMMSDIGEVPRLHYAGIDNLAAGRTAGHFIGRLATQPGRVLVLSNSLSYSAHGERTRGCITQLQAQHPQLLCSEVIECFDDADRCYQAVKHALIGNAPGPLVGLYHSGAGAEGITAALQRFRAEGPRVAWVGHELSDEHRAAIDAGLMDLAIDQDPDGQVLSSVQQLLHAGGFVEQAPAEGPNEFRLFCAQNLPARPYL
jgi:LacI family transcriptional regulator